MWVDTESRALRAAGEDLKAEHDLSVVVGHPGRHAQLPGENASAEDPARLSLQKNGLTASRRFARLDSDSVGLGVLNVSDPITLLDFLFRGGPAPGEPDWPCGPDPTDDDSLGCAEHWMCD